MKTAGTAMIMIQQIGQGSEGKNETLVCGCALDQKTIYH